MKRYRLILAPQAIEAIAGYRDYVAVQSGHNRVAVRWVEQVLASLGELRTMPTKFALAEENAFSRNELRRFLVGKYVALYTIDEAYGVVRVVGFRHGARLPRQADLPDNPTA